MLITTDKDVSALWDMRGLVGTIINYDFPKHMGLYHNRASYIGNKGIASLPAVDASCSVSTRRYQGTGNKLTSTTMHSWEPCNSCSS